LLDQNTDKLDVDEGSTVTDFLPAERARGITIQSAAITFQWPPGPSPGQVIHDAPLSHTPHTINLIDTPGHADFTFEVQRSLRVLDGAICILDGVAGVEAQTDTVWGQAARYQIPRLIYVNKLDRDGVAFEKTIKEVFLKLQVWPALCQIPWWSTEGVFGGVGDVINLRGLNWGSQGDGTAITTSTLTELDSIQPKFAAEIRKARIALVELLSEHDDEMVEEFLACEEDHMAIKPLAILKSLRRCTLDPQQVIVPVFAGASFRNIGVQPLLDAVIDLLPSPSQRPDADVFVNGHHSTLSELVAGSSTSLSKLDKKDLKALTSLESCALAFKVVHDSKRGVLVYVRVYHGDLKQGAPIFNTALDTSERAFKLLRMYASEAAEIQSIGTGEIGVIVGLKHARTGDTLITSKNLNLKSGTATSLKTIKLRPIDVPPPVFFASVEPFSLSEEKQVDLALQTLLREDPSLNLSHDEESGQTLLSGMGELHLEIARDRLIKDLHVKASVGTIEISYREGVSADSGSIELSLDEDFGGKRSRANIILTLEASRPELEVSGVLRTINLPDENRIVIHDASTEANKVLDDETIANLPGQMSFLGVQTAIQAGASAALARGPEYGFPLHGITIHIHFNVAENLFPDTNAGSLATCVKRAILLALKSALKRGGATLLEPVMLVNIGVDDASIGPVAQDLNSARGAQIFSLGEDDSSSSELMDSSRNGANWSVKNVYCPPDPYSTGVVASAGNEGHKRQITARVPLKEMVGYLKHLRSLTGGRGTFVMEVDRFEAVKGPRLRRLRAEL
jgi:elongation factor G